MEGICIGDCDNPPPVLVHEDDRGSDHRVTWGGKPDVLERQGGSHCAINGGRQPQEWSHNICRAVRKSLDLFRCANTQKDPI